MESLRVSKFDGGCMATRINGTPEVLQTNNCSECVYNEHRSTCIMRILDTLVQSNQKNMAPYFKLTDDVDHEEVGKHPNLLEHVK